MSYVHYILLIQKMEGCYNTFLAQYIIIVVECVNYKKVKADIENIISIHSFSRGSLNKDTRNAVMMCDKWNVSSACRACGYELLAISILATQEYLRYFQLNAKFT